MVNNLHQWLIIRLLMVWLVLSVVIGAFCQYLGHARLDKHIVTMAQSETLPYGADFLTYLQAPTASALSLFKQTIQTRFAHDNLIAAEFYTVDSIKVTDIVKPSATEIEQRLPKHGLDFAQAKGISCEQLTLNHQIYLRVFVPIFNGGGAKIGYLEGIYHAPAEIIAQIKSQTLGALVLIVTIIFVTTMVLYPFIIRLNRKLLDYSHHLALTNIGMLEVLGSAIAKRDSDTNTHNYRVALCSVRLGELLHLTDTAMQGLLKGAFLHDVGKIAIPDAILLKAGKLTGEEFAVMQGHVQHGRDILRSYAWLQDADEVVYCHHEKFDGSGYPQGTRGEAIPLNARIFAVVDVFDALTSKRPYKEPFSLETSIEIIREGQGTHFDPQVADLFLGQAAVVYREICQQDEALLHDRLAECIKTYFKGAI